MTSHDVRTPAIRAARPDDAGAISTLLRALGYLLDKLTIAQKITTFSDTLSGAFVATQDGQIIGVVSISVLPAFENVGSHAKITSLIVNTDGRGSGVGRDLVGQAEAFAWSRNCYTIWVAKDAKPGTQAYYESLGYSLDGDRMVKRHPQP